jgi:hypothetical protein
VIGALGCLWLARERRARVFADTGERAAYSVFFAGELLTSLGSAYYHAAPGNATLVWDRLALSLMLGAFFSLAMGEILDRRTAGRALAPATAFALASVLHWHWTESLGRGDLRLYGLAQFYPAVVVPFAWLFVRPRGERARAILLAWALYAAAKACELMDAPIYQLLGFWSGHTLKHLLAAGASLVLLLALRRRAAAAQGCQVSLREPLPLDGTV